MKRIFGTIVLVLICEALITLKLIDIEFVSNPFIFTVSIFFKERPPSNNSHKQPPIILGYTGFFSQKLSKYVRDWSEPFCDYECFFTDDKKFLENATMVLFHGKGLTTKALPVGNLTEKQIKVFLLLESPLNSGIKDILPSDFFDLTVTYRSDSDIHMPYDSFLRIDGSGANHMNYTTWTQSDVKEALSKKRNLALQMASKCNTNSKRELYLREMMKHTNVTVVGSCGSVNCSREDPRCEDDLIESHYFYLAFENSVCPEYVTEKFFRMKRLIVPVVLKRNVAEGVAPPGSFIAADDFSSPQELVAFLEKTAGDRESYLRYFEWTKTYYRNEIKSTAACQLCEVAWKGAPDRKKRDVSTYWSPRSCEEGYASRLLG